MMAWSEYAESAFAAFGTRKSIDDSNGGFLDFLLGLGVWQFTVTCFSVVAIVFIVAWLIRELAPRLSFETVTRLFSFFLEELAGKKGVAGLINGFATLAFVLLTLLVILSSFDVLGLFNGGVSDAKPQESDALGWGILTAVVFIFSFSILTLVERENEVLSNTEKVLDPEDSKEPGRDPNRGEENPGARDNPDGLS